MGWKEKERARRQPAPFFPNLPFPPSPIPFLPAPLTSDGREGGVRREESVREGKRKEGWRVGRQLPTPLLHVFAHSRSLSENSGGFPRISELF